MRDQFAILKPVVFSAWLVCASAAQANGGPWEWTQMTARGNASPRAVTPVRLVRESLTIVIESDGRHYRVDARYELKNPGAATAVKYAVPLLWAKSESPESEGPTPGVPDSFWKSFSLRMNGKPVACSWKDPDGTIPRGSVADEENDWVEMAGGYCTGILRFAAKSESSLQLAYRGELEYVDSGTSKSAVPDFDARKLRYALFPAGYWAGPAEEVVITVELGKFASRTTLLQPGGGKQIEGKAVWRLQHVDLKNIPWLSLTINARDLLLNDFFLRYNRDCQEEWFCFTPTAGATSSLTGSGTINYGPDMMTDGRADTAWCAEKKDEHPKIRLEVRNLHGTVAGQCRVEGLAIAPGYAKDQRTWMANKRVWRVSVQRCDEHREATRGASPAARIPISNMTAELPMYFIDSLEYYDGNPRRIDLGELIQGSIPPCVDILPDATADGEDLCISEVALIYNCG